MYFFVLKYKMTLTVAYHAPFFSQNPNFIPYTNVKQLNTVTTFNSMYFSTERIFFMYEGYTELAPLVAIFCTNMAVEKCCTADGVDACPCWTPFS
jgi:hypothetical protein